MGQETKLPSAASNFLGRVIPVRQELGVRSLLPFRRRCHYNRSKHRAYRVEIARYSRAGASGTPAVSKRTSAALCFQRRNI